MGTDIFFIATISMQKRSVSSWFCRRMFYDFFGTSTLQTKIFLFGPNFMPHTCWYVYDSSTRFFMLDVIAGATKAFDCIDAKVRESKVFLDMCGFLVD